MVSTSADRALHATVPCRSPRLARGCSLPCPGLSSTARGGRADYPRPVRTSPALRGAVALVNVVLVALALAGCAAPRPDIPVPPSPAATAPVQVPVDGVSLSALGFTYGPVDRVFVPIGAQVTSRVDQPDNVAVVLTAPSPADLLTFYRRTAAANGFDVTADDAATSTLTFAGFGWTGTFTGDERASALLLRPAA